MQAKSCSFRWSKADVEGRGLNAGSKVIDRGKRTESKRVMGCKQNHVYFGGQKRTWGDVGSKQGVK